LDQDIQDVAILVHGSRHVMILAVDLEKDFVQVPLATGLRAASP